MLACPAHTGMPRENMAACVRQVREAALAAKTKRDG
jgi:hypothetical protein